MKGKKGPLSDLIQEYKMQLLYFTTLSNAINIYKTEIWNIAFIQKPKWQYTISFLPPELLTEKVHSAFRHKSSKNALINAIKKTAGLGAV